MAACCPGLVSHPPQDEKQRPGRGFPHRPQRAQQIPTRLPVDKTPPSVPVEAS